MSTAKKRTVKYVSLIASLILVFSYFSLLSPTSAYFYKSETKETTLKFAMFNVEEEQPIFDNTSKLKFDGATKLCDFDELLFDRVAIEKEVTLINDSETSEADARIIVDIKPTDDSVTNGLRYVAFVEKILNQPETTTVTETEPETAAEGEETTAETTSEAVTTETTTSAKVEKGALKAELEEKFGITASSTHEEIDAKIDEHNAEINNEPVVLKPGEKAKVRVVFWSEYDPAQDAAGGVSSWQNAGNVQNIEYLCNIRIIASQDNDAAVSAARESTTAVTP